MNIFGYSPETDLNYLGTRGIKSTTVMAKSPFNNNKAPFISKLDLHLKKKLEKCYIWSIALHCAEAWTLRKVD
jgi:hypothetical protein